MTVPPIDLSSRLRGRVAVVTGGARGIGLASARRLAAEGAHVVIADLEVEAGRAAATRVDGSFVRTDVAHRGDVDALFDSVVETHGSIDVVVNNAGIAPLEDGSIESTGLDVWQRVQLVDLTSVYLCCRAALRHMVRAGRGSIINMASAELGSATSQVSTTAAKGGVLALTRELGVRFARQGVRINALCPGPVNTALLQERLAQDPERAARHLASVPIGRFAEPEEVAAAVAFLASEDASFITGAAFLVDGGISAAALPPL